MTQKVTNLSEFCTMRCSIKVTQPIMFSLLMYTWLSVEVVYHCNPV